MKKTILKVLAVIAVIPMLTFTGCGKEKETISTKEDTSLTKVIDNGQLILGLDASFPPMGFRDENDKIVGFDIDLASEVCSRLNIKLKLQPINWDAKEAELNSGNIDCIWNGMSINDSRKKQMNLSEPYMKNEMVLVVLKDSKFKSQADLKNKVIAVQNGSTAQEILKDSDFVKTVKEVQPKKDNQKAFHELEMKTVDAVFVDSVVANYYISSQKKDYRILDEGMAPEEYAIGFRKNDQKLRDKVQKTLSEMKADGKVAEISNKWFGKDITTIK